MKPNRPSKTSEVAVAVVGCGYWGPNLIRNLQALDECRTRLICDTSPARLANMSRLFPGVRQCSDFTSVVGDPEIDAVMIATPARTHFQMAKQCLEAGKHVFVEKPMATRAAEAEELVSLAEAAGLTLMVGHTFLYSAPVRRIREIIDSGDIGEIRYINSRRLNLGIVQPDINVAWDLAPHDLSIILFLMKDFPLRVNCQGSAQVSRRVEDVVNMSLTFPNERFASIQNSWLDPRKVREMTIVGSRRMIVYDDVEPREKIKVYDSRVEQPPHYDTFAEFQFSYHYGDQYSPYVRQEEPLRVQCQHFVECIRSGRAADSDGRNGLAVIQLLEAAQSSLAKDGSAVELAAIAHDFQKRGG